MSASGWVSFETWLCPIYLIFNVNLALLEIKIFMFTFIKNFVLEDAGEIIVPMFSTTLQPRVKGKEAQGVQLPVRISNYNA